MTLPVAWGLWDLCMFHRSYFVGIIVAPYWTDLVVDPGTAGSGVVYTSWSPAGSLTPTLVRVDFKGMKDFVTRTPGINFQVRCRQAARVEHIKLIK